MVRTNQRELVSIVVTADGHRVAVPFTPRDPEASVVAAARRLIRRLLAVLAPERHSADRGSGDRRSPS